MFFIKTTGIPKTFVSKKSALLFCLAALLQAFIQLSPATAQQLKPLKKCLFVAPGHSTQLSFAESNDIKSLRTSIYISGIAFDEIALNALSKSGISGYDLIVVPAATAHKLSRQQLKIIGEAVKQGSNLLFDGVSPLNQELEVDLCDPTITISRIRDLQFPSIPLYWQKPARARPIKFDSERMQIRCINDSTEQPLAVSGKFGKGKYLYYSTYFDPITDKGYSRYPFLTETLKSVFNIEPMAERRAVEMYFDPGMRDTANIDELAKFWRANKIKRIHAGGWYYDEDFDYAKLISACHENGILVYCWFEAPMVSRTFWDKHPQWREKTATNRDAAIDWRLLMNLADTNCRKQVFKEWSDFLLSHDFDGVNFAELYFEPSPVGPNLPENFTPMNLQVRKAYEKQSGYDPAELFNEHGKYFWKTNHTEWKKYAAFRKKLCSELKSYFLGFLNEVKAQKDDFELMLTALDVSLTPELSDFIAEDTQNTLMLHKKYGASLQIEDPSNCWGLTPERYARMGKFYRKVVTEPNSLLFDCNVVGSHEKGDGGFPAEKPTGEEIRQIVWNMALHINRPVFYSEDAINDNDWKNISQTLAWDTKIKMLASGEWEVKANNTILVNTDLPGISLLLDGKPWCALAGSFIIIPKGIHVVGINPDSRFGAFATIKSISGELLEASCSEKNLEFTYSEDNISCYVILDRAPSSTYIDGKKKNFTVYAGPNSEFTLKLPSGTHHIKIE